MTGLGFAVEPHRGETFEHAVACETTQDRDDHYLDTYFSVNDRAGIRTQDLRIKSPLLCQLSYPVELVARPAI